MTRDTDERGKLADNALEQSVNVAARAIISMCETSHSTERKLGYVSERIRHCATIAALRAPAGHAEREALIERLRSSASDLCHPDGCCYAETMLKAAAALSNAPAPASPVTTEQLDELQFGRRLHTRPRAPSEGVRETCDCAVMCQDLGIQGGCRYIQPGRDKLRKLVDVVYKHAADCVPMTDIADKLIDEVFAPADTEDQGPDTLGERP